VTLAIVAVVVLGALALAAGIVWAMRDVARYRIDTDVAREAAKHITVGEERLTKLEARVLKTEQQIGFSKR
jgi:hypothetical protein